MPVVEATAVADLPDPESKTIVAKLPADPAAEQPDDAAAPAPAPKRRRGLRRRKQPAEAGVADPWEA
jgi:hypothetical protein